MSRYNDYATIKRYFKSCETFPQFVTTCKIYRRWRLKYGCDRNDDIGKELSDLHKTMGAKLSE